METIINFISNHFTPLCTLLATIIGGLISFLSTSIAENRKNKYEIKKEKLVDILIPYCTDIENTNRVLNSIYYDDFSTEIKDFKIELEKPLLYLKATKRVYLSKNQIKLLEQYGEKLDDFYEKWKNDYHSVYKKYVHWIYDKIKDFPNIAYSTINISLSFSKQGQRALYLSLIRQRDCSLINSISGVSYIHNDDPENCKTTDIDINDNTYWNLEAINNGIMTIDDIEIEKQLPIYFLEYISEINDISVLNKFISSTSVSKSYIYIIEILEEINKDLIKEIDKITK